VVNSEWKEKDVLFDKIFKDTNAGARAINHELLPFCLVVLGGSVFFSRLSVLAPH
jgi:hypothetical protein